MDEQPLSNLQPYCAERAAYYSDELLCLPEIRFNLRMEFVEWAKSDKLDTRIFWILGVAGTVKSTIARTAAEHFNDQGHIVASYFFSRTEADPNNTRTLVSTIACQLANDSAILKHWIRIALRECWDYFSHTLKE